MSDLLTETERRATGYLFLQLKAMYPDTFGLVWPDQATLAASKRFYAERIGQLSREQIDDALDQLLRYAVRGDKGFDKPSLIHFFQVVEMHNKSRREREAEERKALEYKRAQAEWDALPQEEKDRRRQASDEARRMLFSLNFTKTTRFDSDGAEVSHERG